MLELPPDPRMDQGGEAAPEAEKPPVKDPLEDEDFADAVKALIEAARSHMDDTIQARARRAWKYYQGKVDAPPANEIIVEDGEDFYEGSSVVIRTCADQLRMMVPEIARVFLASDEAVAYTPQSKEDEEFCEQATDYANYVYKVENDGENLMQDCIVNWGVIYAAVEYYWKVDKRRTKHEWTGVSHEAMLMMQAEADAKQDVVFEAKPREILVPQMVQGPDGQPVEQLAPEYAFDISIEEVSEDKSRICIGSIAHDEFLIDPFSQSREEPLLIGTDRRRLVSDIVAMGVPLDVVLAHKGQTGAGTGSQDGWGRRTTSDQNRDGQHETGDSALDVVRLVEAVVRLDRDGDGIAEPYRVLCLGDEHVLVQAKDTDEGGYIVASPYRVPHEPIGTGIVEETMDLQDMQTSLMRGSLNNFHRCNHPREVVPATDDAAFTDLKSWYGGPIRTDNPSLLAWHVVPYVGDKAFAYLQFFNDIAAKRTGVSEASQGLDPDIMKGQTSDGAKAVVLGPQARMEHLIREYALGIMRPLFRGILRLSVKYQDKAKTIRLRNQWVEVTPSQWNPEMDAQPRVGLGTGTRNERMQGLMVILAKQEQLLATGSPLADMEGYRQSLAELCELTGRKDSARYFKEMTAEELQQAMQQAQEAAKQQALEQAQMAAMVEGAKAEGQAKVKGQVDLEKAKIDSLLEMQKATLATDQAQRAHEADIAVQRESKAMDLAVQREDMAQKYQLAMETLRQQRELKMYELSIEKELEEKRISRKAASGDGNVKEMAN
jgi:hypothetical protein